MNPQSSELEIEKLRTGPALKLPRTSTFISYKQSREDASQPLCNFLRRFGNIIPEPQAESLHTSSDLIRASYVNFHTLDKVAGIKIEWVNCLSLHMEFDLVRRTLKLFKFPSLCRLMCGETTVLSKYALLNNFS
jgi:hypothetical protein